MGNNAPPPTTAARRRAFRAAGAVLVLASVLPLIGGCVKANPPTDVGNPVSPSTTSAGGAGPTTLPPASGPLSYDQDMKPIFDSDCVSCHNNSFAAGRYSMASYQAVLRDVIPGSASSRLVTTTQPGGSMYRYFSGDRATKAALTRAWVVDNKAAQTR